MKTKISRNGKTQAFVRLNHYYHCESLNVARGRYFRNVPLVAWTLSQYQTWFSGILLRYTMY